MITTMLHQAVSVRVHSKRRSDTKGAYDIINVTVDRESGEQVDLFIFGPDGQPLEVRVTHEEDEGGS